MKRYWAIIAFFAFPLFAVADEDSQGIVANYVPGETGPFDTTEESTEYTPSFNVNYSAIFFGPALKGPRSYQPTISGDIDLDRPVVLKNFIGVGYNITNDIAITGTGYWIWQPIGKQQVELLDPFVRISHNSLVHQGNFNLYSDFQIHPGVSALSRQNDVLFGLQSVQVATYALENSRITLGTYASSRFNGYGKKGYGNNWEFYLGPNVSYQLLPELTFTLLYEMRGSHSVGRRLMSFNNEGTDLEPGLSWDVTPRLNVNPYLTIQTGGKVNLSSTAIGMMVNWNLM
jgi:hypothetical protein